MSTFDTIRGVLDDVDQHVLDLEQQLAAARTDVESARTALAAATERVTALETQATSDAATIATLREGLSSAEQRYADASRRVSALETEVTALRAAVTQRDAEIVQLRARIAELEPPRVAAQEPFAAASPWHSSIGTGATYDTTSAQRANLLTAPNATVNAGTYAPARWLASQSDPAVTIRVRTNAGVLVETLTLRVPASRRLPGDATLAGQNPDSQVIVVEPDGRTCHQFYKLLPDGSGGYTATRHLVYDLVDSEGWPKDGSSAGVRAARTDLHGGLMTAQELADARIEHVLALAGPNEVLHASFIPPAAGYDANGATAYSGLNPMGTRIALPPTFDIDAHTINGQPVTARQREFLRTLRDRGGFLTDRSTYLTAYAERDADPAHVAEVKAALQSVWRQLAIVTNADAGTPRRPAAGPVSA